MDFRSYIAGQLGTVRFQEYHPTLANVKKILTNVFSVELIGNLNGIHGIYM